MHLKTVSVSYGRKLNLGDYNSVNVEVSAWAELDEGDDVDTVMRDLMGMAKTNVRVQLIAAQGQGKLDATALKRLEETYLGLPIRRLESEASQAAKVAAIYAAAAPQEQSKPGAEDPFALAMQYNRKRLKLTLKALAGQAGMTIARASSIERGDVAPTDAEREALALALGLDFGTPTPETVADEEGEEGEIVDVEDMGDGMFEDQEEARARFDRESRVLAGATKGNGHGGNGNGHGN
jgi:transcriptional regulator with XRE-family HTH domain